MKISRILIFVLLILSTMAVMAQELTETVTIGPITVSHPANYTAEEVTPGAMGMIDDTESFAILIFTGDGVNQMGGLTGVTELTALNVIEGLSATTEVTGEPIPVSLPNGDGFMIAAIIPDIGSNGLVYAIDTEDGLLLAFLVAREGDVSEEFRALGENVISTVVIDPSAVEVVATTEPELDAPEATATPTTETELDDPTGDEDGCPIAVEDLPENTVQFCLGAEMTLPDNWTLIDGTEEVDSSASLTRGSFSVNLSTSVSEVSQYYNPDMYATDVITFTADIAGHETYDAAEHVVTLLEEEGRKVSVYDPSAYVELTEDDVHQVTYIVTLNNDLFVVHTFTWVPSLSEDAEEIAAEIEEVALSTKLADFYEGVPAFIEVDGEIIFVFEATAFDSSYMFTVEDEAEFLATCPAEMSGDESTVWGTDVYTDDSSVCLAAAHAGAITLADGGTVKVTMLPGEESYTGSTRNGVTTQDYGSWSGSFSVEAFELP